MSDSGLKQHLLSLESIMTEERWAITHLQMERLNRLMDKKTDVLESIRESAHEVDDDCLIIIGRISSSNKRNGKLIKSGLAQLARLQDNAFRSLALTYRQYGQPLEIGSGPRVFSRRF